MNWRFIDLNTLKECESGYTLNLISGTWFHPRKIKPAFSSNIDSAQQKKLLRAGLLHIKSIGSNDYKEAS